MQILVKPSVPDIDRFLTDLKPNDNITEFIDGETHCKQIPQGSAIYLQAQLWDEINATVPNLPQAIAYPNHRCSFGGWSIVPDLAVFLDLPASPPLTQEQPKVVHFHSSLTPVCTRYPDWMIEILVPGQDAIHTIRTVLHCLTHGTQMVWLIDLNNRLTFVFVPDKAPLEIKGNTLLPSPTGLNLSLTVEKILGWVPSRTNRTF